MAFAHNIWRSYLIDQSDQNARATGSVLKFREIQERTEEMVDEPARLQAFILSNLLALPVAIVPVGQGKVQFLHSFYEGGAKGDEKWMTGLAGFSAAAMLKTVKTADAARGLVKLSVGKFTGDVIVPSFEQLLTAESEKELRDLDGSLDLSKAHFSRAERMARSGDTDSRSLKLDLDR